MKKRGLFFACVGALILVFAGITLARSSGEHVKENFSETSSPNDPLNDTYYEGALYVCGVVTEQGTDSLTIDNQSTVFSPGPVVLLCDFEETKILDCENGWPISLPSIQTGDTVYAYIGETMTLNLPPTVTAKVVLAQPAADSRIPIYGQVSNIETSGDGTARIQMYGGDTYMIPANCEILPYKTRNIVTLQDIANESIVLIWADENNRAEKIILFQTTVE